MSNFVALIVKDVCEGVSESDDTHGVKIIYEVAAELLNYMTPVKVVRDWANDTHGVAKEEGGRADDL